MTKRGSKLISRVRSGGVVTSRGGLERRRITLDAATCAVLLRKMRLGAPPHKRMRLTIRG